MPNSNQPSPLAGGNMQMESKFNVWTVGVALVAAALSVGGLYFKVDAQKASLDKIEAKLDARDERLTTLTQTVLIQSSKNENQQGAIDRTAADVASLRGDLNSLIYTRKSNKELQ